MNKTTPKCLSLTKDYRKMKNDDIAIIKKADGKPYSVRKSRSRYFFPNEWEKFINTFVNEKHSMFFSTMLNTGGRPMEVLNLTAGNFDFKAESIEFKVVKTRVANKQLFSAGESRRFFITNKFNRMVKKYVLKNNIKPEEYIFLDNSKLPANYKNLLNIEKKKYYEKYKSAYSRLFKRHVIIADIEENWNLSLYNIRKTYGNWMRIFEDVSTEDLCYRMGHTLKTFMKHYGSSLLFNSSDKMKIQRILGDVK